MTQITLRPGRRGGLPAAIAATALVLAACSAASPSAPAASQGGGGSSRCAVTPDATATATMEITGTQFGDEITVSAGDVVEFSNGDSLGHTVTEGTNGTAAADACVDEPIAAGATVVVTFTEPGDYQITCKIHPSMHTAIHVE